MFGEKISFHTQPGNLPSVMCTNSMMVGQLFSQIQTYQGEKEEAYIAADILEKS